MKVQGIIEIVKNSKSLPEAKYAYYIGDGDSKTFTNLSDAKSYGDDFIVQKPERVLHVGKRMFRHLKDVIKTLTELRKIKRAEEKKKEEQAKKEKAKKIEETPMVKQPRKKRTIDNLAPPPPKTTDFNGKIMKQMSTNYSLIIQRYPDNLTKMKREIWAGFYHLILTDKIITAIQSGVSI